DAVGTGHDRSNLPGFEEVADHVVGDEREGNAAFVELPSGEARALQVRARFGHEHVEVAALLDGDADDPESGADATGGEGARVALGHDLAVPRHEFGAEAADGLVGGLLFQMDLLGFGDERFADLREVGGLRGELGEARLHAFERPKQVDGGGTRFGKNVADFGELRAQFGDRVGGGVLHAERDTHGGGDTYGRRAPNHHLADGFGDVAVVRVGVMNFCGRQKALVEHDHAAVGPFDGSCYVHWVLRPRHKLLLYRRKKRNTRRQWPAGMRVKPWGEMMAEAAIIEL